MAALEHHDSLSPEIIDFYNRGLEADRLRQGLGRLEYIRSQELMRRYLPAPRSTARPTIYDIGGGPGAYSLWLATLGFEVYLVDAMPLHIKQARERSAAQPNHPLAGATVGDARSLDVADESADAVILHGPLYHLIARSDRLAAIREANRILRPGGVVLAFAIPAHASTLLGLQRWWIKDPAYLAMCYTELTSGIHKPPESWPHLFTTAYFHRPEELVEELETGGLLHDVTLAIEGPAVIVPDLEEHMADEEERSLLLELIRLQETDAVAVGMSAHIVAVARKPA